MRNERMRMLESRVDYLEQVQEELVRQNLSLATNLSGLQRDTTALAQAVLRLASLDPPPPGHDGPTFEIRIDEEDA